MKEVIMNSQLDEMKKTWVHLGITSHFAKAHHFSSAKFRTRPGGLGKFIRWCEKREIKKENLQTIERARRAANLFEKNNDIDKAIAQAWKEYPVLSR